MKISRAPTQGPVFTKRNEFDRLNEGVDHVVIELLGNGQPLRIRLFRKRDLKIIQHDCLPITHDMKDKKIDQISE
jgi:hypothetical protein